MVAKEGSPGTTGARRCTNPDCEYGGRWIVGGMKVMRNGRFLCTGRGCHTTYDPREVIDPANDDYRLYVN